MGVAQSSLVTSFAKSAMTLKTLQHASQVLQSKDIDTLDDGTYHFICHPYVAFQLETQAGFKGWMTYTTNEPAKRLAGTTTLVAGVTVRPSTLAYKFTLSGDTMSTASGALYCSLLLGKEAFGVTSIAGDASGRDGFAFFLKESGPQSTGDPANKLKQAAFSITAVAKILNKSAGVWVMTTTQA